VPPGTFMVEKDTGRLKLSTAWGSRWNDLSYSLVPLTGDSGEERIDPAYLNASMATLDIDNDTIVFRGPDSRIAGMPPRLWRPMSGAIYLGNDDDVAGKWIARGAINVFEINDTPEFIGRRSEGLYVGSILAETTTTATFTRGVSTSISCTNLHNGTTAWLDTGYVQIENGSGNATYSYSSINRAAGTISGLTLLAFTSAVTVFAAGSTVTAMSGPNTNVWMAYGQCWMGAGGFQDRSAQIAIFTADVHCPDGFGGYHASGYMQFFTSSPGPGSQRRTQMTLDEKGFLALQGSGFLDKSAILSTSARFTVAPKNSRLNGAVALPAATIPVLDPSGFPTAGSFNVTSDAGSQTVAYTGYSINATTGKWEFTGCSGGTGTAADQAFVQIPKTTVTNGIGTIRCNIVAQNDGSNDTVTIGKIGPTAADPEAGIKLGGSSGAVEIYRGASGEAWTADIFRFLASGSTPAVKIHVSGEAEARLSFRVGGVFWGPGGSTAVDTSLRRVGVAGLAVRDSGDTADGDLRVLNMRVTGALDHEGSTVGFYNTTPIVKQTGVAVSTAAIHAALVNLGLIAA
jgi:hypothetical protein